MQLRESLVADLEQLIPCLLNINTSGNLDVSKVGQERRRIEKYMNLASATAGDARAARGQIPAMQREALDSVVQTYMTRVAAAVEALQRGETPDDVDKVR